MRRRVELAIQLTRSEEVRDRLNPQGIDVYLEILLALLVDNAIYSEPVRSRREHEVIDPDAVSEEHLDRMAQSPRPLARNHVERVQLHSESLTFATEPGCRLQVIPGVDQRFSSHRQLTSGRAGLDLNR